MYIHVSPLSLCTPCSADLESGSASYDLHEPRCVSDVLAQYPSSLDIVVTQMSSLDRAIVVETEQETFVDVAADVKALQKQLAHGKMVEARSALDRKGQPVEPSVLSPRTAKGTCVCVCVFMCVCVHFHICV
jgi:hypothetical protein